MADVDRAAVLERAAGEGPFRPAYRKLTIGLILVVVGVAFEALAVATIMPATIAELGGLRLYGWAFSAFLLANLLGIVIAGEEADRIGPAAPFAAGVALFTIGLLVGGFANSMAILIAGRVVQGFGGGIIGSIAYVTVGRGYPAPIQPRILAFMSTAWVVPGLVGPAIAGVIAEAIGWRWVFLGLAPLPPLAALLVFPALRRIRAGSSQSRDVGRLWSALRLSGGAGLLLAGLGQSSPLFSIPMVSGGALLAIPALARLLPAGTLRARAGLPAAVGVMGLLNLAFFGVDAFVPLALVEVRHRSVAFAGLALTAATIFWTSGSWVQARFSSRVSRRRLVRTGLSLVSIGSLGTALLLVPRVSVLAGPFAWGVAGLGMGIAYSTLSLTILENAAAGREGEAAASIQLANVLGGGLGTGIGGAAIGLLGSEASGLRTALATQFLAMVAVLGFALVIAGRLPGRRPLFAPDQGEPAQASSDVQHR